MLLVLTIPPAAFVGPSLPSVPAESKRNSFFRFFFLISFKKCRENSWFLPPFPLPLTLTVVSPPDRSINPINFGFPVISLATIDAPLYDSDNLPAELAKIEVIRPGSRKI